MINWSVRFKNKTWLLAMIGVVVAFIYQVLGLFGVVPPVAQDEVSQLIGLLVNILAAFGVVQDPTTAGMKDSERAMSYTKPH